MSRLTSNIMQSFVVSLIGALLFIPFLGQVHLFDWDEINFAESAREMIVSGNYFRVQINYEPFWEKPPLFIWLQVLSMKIFGVNEFAARFPNVVCGIVTLNAIYFIARRHFSPSMASWWILCYLGTFTAHLYFKTGIIDPVFNLFTFLALYEFFLASIKPKAASRRKQFILAGVFAGLAILTKGPAALLVLFLCGASFLIMQRLRTFFNTGDILSFIAAVFIVSFAWFGPETIMHGPWFLEQFISYQWELLTQNVAGHQQPFWYHPVVLLLGCFPVSIIALKGFQNKIELDNSAEVCFRRWMKILFWVVLILFSIVKTKIVHYSSLCWLPLSFLAAFAIDNVTVKRFEFNNWIKMFILIAGLIIGAALTLVPVVLADPSLKILLLSKLKDVFARGNFEQPVFWYGWEWMIGVGYLIALFWGVVALFNDRLTRGFMILLISTAITVQVAGVLIAPRIEAYSQGGAIRFYESLKGQDVYIETVGFKSYAQYFYTEKMPSQKNPFQSVDSLMTATITKPAYFVIKNTYKPWPNEKPGIRFVGEKGGFVFFKRDP